MQLRSRDMRWLILLALIGAAASVEVHKSAPLRQIARGRKAGDRKRHGRNAEVSNSAWGEWSEWSTCNVSCEWGYATRVRDCLRAEACFGMSMISEPCEVPKYCTHGGWSPWSSWLATTSCSRTCGSGHVINARTRSCDSVALGCPGEAQQFGSSKCVHAECFVNGSWGFWSTWVSGSCSVTCNFGTRLMIRRRLCDSPPPSGGGEQCEGPSNKTFIQPCKVAVPCGVAPANSDDRSEATNSFNHQAVTIMLSVILGVPTLITILCLLGALVMTLCFGVSEAQMVTAMTVHADETPSAFSVESTLPSVRAATALKEDSAAVMVESMCAVNSKASAPDDADLTITHAVLHKKSIDSAVRVASGSL